MKEITLSVTAFVAGGLGGTVHGVTINPGGDTGGGNGPLGPINGVLLNPGGDPGGFWGGPQGPHGGGGGPGPINGVVVKPGG